MGKHSLSTFICAIIASTLTALAATRAASHMATSPPPVITHIELLLLFLGAFLFALSSIILHYHHVIESTRHQIYTDQKRAEKFQSLVEHIPDAVWTFDTNGTPHYISPAVYEIFGISSQEFIAKGAQAWWNAIDPSDLSSVKNAYEKLFTRGIPMDVEYRVKRPDGSLGWVRHKSTHVTKEGPVTLADGVIADITRLKEATSQLETRSKDLERINALMVGREVRMADLKQQLDVLRKKTSFESFIGGNI